MCVRYLLNNGRAYYKQIGPYFKLRVDMITFCSSDRLFKWKEWNLVSHLFKDVFEMPPSLRLRIYEEKIHFFFGGQL